MLNLAVGGGTAIPIDVSDRRDQGLFPFVSFPGVGPSECKSPKAARVSNPSASYAADTTCTAVAFDGVNSTDASRFFTERFAEDVDGTAPWDFTATGPVVPIQLTLADTPVGNPVPTGRRAAALKKCKKKFKGKAKAKKRKKCKKKANLLPV